MSKYLRLGDFLLNKRYVLNVEKRTSPNTMAYPPEYDVVIYLSMGNGVIEDFVACEGVSEMEAEKRLNEVWALLEED